MNLDELIERLSLLSSAARSARVEITDGNGVNENILGVDYESGVVYITIEEREEPDDD